MNDCWCEQETGSIPLHLCTTQLDSVYSRTVEIDPSGQSIASVEEATNYEGGPPERALQVSTSVNVRLPFNDSNPQNYVKVKLNHPQLFGDKPHLQPIAKPFIIVPEPRKPRKFISANKKYIKTSLKKYPVR